MSESKNWSGGSLINSPWLNAVDATVFEALGDAQGNNPTTGAQVRQNLGVLSAAQQAAVLSASSGSSLVGYLPAGTGAVATTVQGKLRESVSVLDYMTPADIASCATYLGSVDVTYAFNAASDASNYITLPPGYFTLENFWHKSGKVFIGSGIRNTYLLQKATGNPAWWCVSTPTKNSGGQNHGCVLKGVWFIGKTGSTVASCIVEGLAPYVVAYSEFDIGGSNGFHTLEIKTGSAFEVYSSKFSVVQDGYAGVDPSGNNIGSYDTGVICGSGVYNDWYLNVGQSQTGMAYTVSGFDNIFHHCVSDAAVTISGQNNTFIGLTIEGWTGAARTACIYAIGFNTTFVNGPHIITVSRAKCLGPAITTNGSGAGNSLIISGMRITATNISLTFTGALTAATTGTLTAPWADVTGDFLIDFSNAFTFTTTLAAATSGTLSAAWTSASGIYNIAFSNEAFEDAIFTNGATTCTWINAITATASATASCTRVGAFTAGGTTVTWGGAITAAAASSAAINVPISPLFIRENCSGVINNSTASTPYRIDNQPGTIYAGPPRPSDLSRFTFGGDCTLVLKGTFFNDSGTATFAAATTVVVVLTKLQPDTSYRVALAPEANKTFWITAKTQQGFTLNASSASSDVVDWTVTR